MSGAFEFRNQNALAFESREPEVLLAGAAGTGKSILLLTKVLALLDKYPKCRGLFCRGTRASLTDSGLVTWETEVLGDDHAVLLENPTQRRVRQSYRFPNGSELVVRGLDNVGKVLSSQYDFIYIQEGTEEDVSYDIYETLLSRLRNGRMVKNGEPWHQMMVDCNPTTPTHWLYKRQLSGLMRMYTSTHRDNPAYWDAKAQDWTALGRNYVVGNLAKYTGTRRARFYEGKWVRAFGAVYDGFVDAVEPDGHLHDFGWRPPRHWRRVWGIDWGFSNPTCLLMAALDEDDRIHFYKEFYATRTRAEDLAKWAKAQVDSGQEPLPLMTVCDHNPEHMADFAHYGPAGCPIQLADKGDKVGGIEYMQGLFDVQDDGKPRIYFTRGMLAHPPDDTLTGRAACCLEELGGYKWDRSEKADKNDKDVPVDSENHAMDAARYLCKFVAKHTQKPTKPRKNRTHPDPFGRLPSYTFR